mgnify:CR=1 FL=1
MSHGDQVPSRARIKVWDALLRLFHWLLVIAMAVAFLSAEEASPLNHWHMLSGWVAAILIAFRVVWGFVGGEHARFSSISKGGGLGHHMTEMLRFKPESAIGHNPVGWVSAVLLISVSVATIWSGALIVTSGGEVGEDFHEIIGWSLLALIVAHVAAVIIMSVLTRENLVRAMVTGSKPTERHPDEASAKRPSFFAYLIALATLAAAIFGVLKIDPQAFVPRSTEMTEREGNEGQDEDGRDDYEIEMESDGEHYE